MPETGKKLQLKTNHTLLLLHAPASFADALQAEGYTFTHTDEAPAVGIYDAVQLFVRNREELDHLAPLAIPLLKPASLLWIAYPKKSSGIKSDLTRDEGWRTLTELGYTVVRQVALDDTWSALRFKLASERNEASRFGVDLPGIDRKTKTVTPPEDLQQALEQAGLVEKFNKLAFTHRKEYVVAVLDAKRPETRAKRIQKTLEALNARS